MGAMTRRLVVASAIAMGGALALLPATAGADSAPPQLAWPQGGATATSVNLSYDFGTLDASQGQSATQTFTLSNIGGRATGALSISLSPSSAFSITADSCTGTSLSGNHHNSCQIAVAFAPIANGQSYSATLTADGTKAEATLSLTGASTTPGGFGHVPGGWNRIQNTSNF